MGGELTKLKFDLRTFSSDTMLNHQLSQKLKLIRIGKFNHLTINLTKISLSQIRLLRFSICFFHAKECYISLNSDCVFISFMQRSVLFERGNVKFVDQIGILEEPSK
jgi:hypothetical protein